MLEVHFLRWQTARDDSERLGRCLSLSKDAWAQRNWLAGQSAQTPGWPIPATTWQVSSPCYVQTAHIRLCAAAGDLSAYFHRLQAFKERIRWRCCRPDFISLLGWC